MRNGSWSAEFRSLRSLLYLRKRRRQLLISGNNVSKLMHFNLVAVEELASEALGQISTDKRMDHKVSLHMPSLRYWLMRLPTLAEFDWVDSGIRAYKEGPMLSSRPPSSYLVLSRISCPPYLPCLTTPHCRGLATYLRGLLMNQRTKVLLSHGWAYRRDTWTALGIINLHK